MVFLVNRSLISLAPFEMLEKRRLLVDPRKIRVLVLIPLISLWRMWEIFSPTSKMFIRINIWKYLISNLSPVSFPLLEKGVRVYLDSIISSDDVTQTITRNLSIPGLSSDSTRNQAVMQIEKLEQDYNILPKLKVSYKKAMVSGSFFVYHIAYKRSLRHV